MASGIADYAENKILEHSVGRASWTMPATWIALYTAAPGDAGGGTEVTGGSYARFATTTTTHWAAASGGSIANLIDLVFPTATANWGTITSVAILDAATVGNFIWWGDLSASKVVNSGDVFKFLAGQLVATLT
jgi:hypothetical protein